MIGNSSPRTSSAARADALRDARKRLLDTLSAKERIETRIAGHRREVSTWRDRVELARRRGDDSLRAAAEARLGDAERKLAASIGDREALDVHVVRLRHEVRSAQGLVPPRPLPTDEPRDGAPDVSDRPRDPRASLDWAALARHELDQEIDQIRRRAARREEEGHGHR